MSDTILILVATMSGTAEMVADEVADRIDDRGQNAKIVRMEKATPSTLAGAQAPVVICSSTYGTGDVPDNGAALYEALRAERPDLSGLRYGVIALGDSIYPQTFCFGGHKFDALLSELGGVRIGDCLEHDCRSGIYPEEAAAEWLEDWLTAIKN